MDQATFARYKKEFVSATRRVLEVEHSANLAEAGFPAYGNPNALISFLFWERLYRVIQHVERKGKLSSVMDFGCGSGVMLPVLSRLSDQVTAVDIDLAPAQRISEFVSFTGNVTFASSCEGVPPGSLDLILALDVLEHVDDLDAILADLCALLSPDGEIIVSGPTENRAYKVGRFLAGPVYSGDYHVRDIYQIKQALQKFVDVRTLAALFFPVPLFVIYSGTA